MTGVGAIAASDLVAAGDAAEHGSQRHPETMLSLRWRGVVRQAFDYSCGTGAIANLVSLVGGKVPEERNLIEQYIASRSPDEVQAAMKEGFSLLDLKLMLQLLGYQSAGVRYERGTMPDESHPMIVYLVVKGYRHFAVFAGTEDRQVVLLDPARGRIRISIDRFVSEWDGSALVLLGQPGEKPIPVDEDGLTRAQETARSAVMHR